MRFVPVLLGTFFAFEILDLSGDVADVGYRVVRSLVVVVIFWGLRNLVDPLSAVLARLERIERYVLESGEFVSPDDTPTFVRIDSFGDSSIDILLYCFTHTTNWGEWLAAKERLAYHVKDVVESAGSSFAFPSRSLYIETPAGERAELFVPPAEPKDSRSEGVSR